MALSLTTKGTQNSGFTVHSTATTQDGREVRDWYHYHASFIFGVKTVTSAQSIIMSNHQFPVDLHSNPSLHKLFGGLADIGRASPWWLLQGLWMFRRAKGNCWNKRSLIAKSALWAQVFFKTFFNLRLCLRQLSLRLGLLFSWLS